MTEIYVLVYFFSALLCYLFCFINDLIYKNTPCLQAGVKYSFAFSLIPLINTWVFLILLFNSLDFAINKFTSRRY